MTDQELIEYLEKHQWLKPEQLDYCMKMSHEKKLPLLQILHQEKYLALDQTTPADLETHSKNSEPVSEFLENLLKTKLSVEASSEKTSLVFPESLEPLVNSVSDSSGSPTISGRYEVIENLGSGGMGVVQCVRDCSLGREVALKKIKIVSSGKMKLSQGEHILLERLKREASITAILEHPNIVPIYDLQEEDSGEVYFTMRKIEGQTLRELLKSKRNGKNDLDENRLLSIYLKICDAIRYAHSRNIIHRDIKPENIMVGPFGEVYVVDWGLAKKIASGSSETSKLMRAQLHGALLSMENEVAYDLRTVGGIGTPGYMSPEQSENAREVTITTDIYSLGKILRECFTFLSPLEEIRFSLTHQKKESPKKIFSPKKTKTTLLDKQVPPEIHAIALKAFQEKPQERYRSVLELKEDIERYQKNMRVLVKEYGPLEAFVKWIQRNRHPVFISLFLITISLFFGIYVQWKEATTAELEF
ncbi:MAG: serine/threonine-protein kinase, partial [Planctomycetota bacterium]